MAYQTKTKKEKMKSVYSMKSHRHDYKHFYVDFNNLESQKKAERKKSYLENKGYNQVSMTSVGYDKFVLVYKK